MDASLQVSASSSNEGKDRKDYYPPERWGGRTNHRAFFCRTRDAAEQITTMLRVAQDSPERSHSPMRNCGLNSSTTDAIRSHFAGCLHPPK